MRIFAILPCFDHWTPAQVHLKWVVWPSLSPNWTDCAQSGAKLGQIRVIVGPHRANFGRTRPSLVEHKQSGLGT